MKWFDPAILFALFCALLIVLVLVSRRVKNLRTRYGIMQLVLILVVLGLVVVVEMFSLYKIYKRWDLTQNQRFTLAPMTVNILKSLESPLVATAFTQTEQNRKQYETLLSNAAYYNSSKIEYEFVDPERDFVKASEFPQPLEPPVLYLKYQDRLEKVTQADEESFTRALVKLTQGEQKTIYMLQGHGERSMMRGQGQAGASFGEFENLMSSQNRMLRTCEIDPKELKVPDDCDVLLIAGPEIDFSSPEYSVLESYLVHGGKIILMLDSDKAQGVAQWVSKFGLDMPNDLIIEMEESLQFTQSGIQPVTTLNLAVFMELQKHEINQGLERRRVVAIEARSVQPREKMPEGLRSEILATSNENAWAELEPDYDNLKEAVHDEGIEKSGFIPMAVLIQGDFATALAVPSVTDATAATLIVIGDSDFASDRTYGKSYGVNLLANMVNYLTQDTDLISIPPKTQADSPYVAMTAARWGNLLLLSFVVVPGVVAACGVGVYFRRRRSG